MHYYNVVLPIKPDRLFIYKSEVFLETGSRIVISLGRTLYTGIVWNKVDNPDPAIKYKSVIEIIDDHPFITADLRDQAEWMRRYYRTSLGQVLTAILPASFNIRIQQKIKRIPGKACGNISPDNRKIFDAIPESSWIELKELKKQVRISRFYLGLEELERDELIEIERVTDRRQKRKTINYIKVKNPWQDQKLTEKQKKVFDLIRTKGGDVPLAALARKTSYSVIKALRKKDLIEIEAREEFVRELPMKLLEGKKKKIRLNDEQKKAAEEICSQLDQREFKVFLLHGVTGSGKTEVYIEVIKSCLKLGSSALMLVPEISLTPQMVNRFYREFGEEIAILHSHLSDRNRWLQWQKIRRGDCRIVIGARSAVFAPLEKPGVIIVDEEHENSYKQENSPRYNARDFAIVRGREYGSAVILGSATPALESWHNTRSGKYKLLQLTRRPFSYPLPVIRLIDMRSYPEEKSSFSQPLRDAILKRLEKKEQVILLQNRRGHSSFIQCLKCGNLLECPDCDISLTYHSKTANVVCHYCGYSENLPRKCPECGSYRFSFGAPGTQQVEKQLRLLYPAARILRMDSDTTKGRESYDNMYARMTAGEVDILLGTQMIAKGLDFPNVTLVGVISADVNLNVPDFRAAERTFQLITQVAGRSGRAEKPGEVMIQTYSPEHYAIRSALDHDYEAFSTQELVLRKRLNYPPHFRLARIIYSSESPELIRSEMNKLRITVKKVIRKFSGRELFILGPVEAPLAKISKRYRYHIIIKAKEPSLLAECLNYIDSISCLPGRIRTVQDVDPMSLM